MGEPDSSMNTAQIRVRSFAAHDARCLRYSLIASVIPDEYWLAWLIRVQLRSDTCRRGFHGAGIHDQPHWLLAVIVGHRCRGQLLLKLSKVSLLFFWSSPHDIFLEQVIEWLSY